MANNREQRLMPDGVPKYVRCYDNGGETWDRYTVVYTGNYRRSTGGSCWYVGMSSNPFHPQGFGQHGENQGSIDTNKWGYAPAMGRKNHLGKRIPFDQLPEQCKKLVIQDYKSLWSL